MAGTRYVLDMCKTDEVDFDEQTNQTRRTSRITFEGQTKYLPPGEAINRAIITDVETGAKYKVISNTDIPSDTGGCTQFSVTICDNQTADTQKPSVGSIAPDRRRTRRGEPKVESGKRRVRR